MGDGVTTLYDNLAWAAHGAPKQLTLHDAAGGTGTVNWVQTFNARLWPAQIKTGPGITANTSISATSVLLGLNYTGYENDGNVTEQERTGGGDPAPGTRTMEVDRATNRLAGTGVEYDALGNLQKTADSAYKLYYQDQGHALDMKDAGGTTLLYRYFYDADGKRRIKARAAGGVVDLDGDCSYCFYEGEDLVCQQDRGEQVQEDGDFAFYRPKFLLLDHLGTTRAELSFNGTAPIITQSYDTMPYGELIAPPVTLTEQALFTGKQRNKETVLDDFGPRLSSPTFCRWLSTDADGKSFDSQMNTPYRWNKYQYSSLNPINRIDPDGKTDININIIRYKESPRSTLGIYSVRNSNVAGYTLELPDQENRENVSRIPSGKYSAHRGRSRKLGETIYLERVPGRSGIAIHPGNKPKNTTGCVLVGLSAGEDMISSSRKAYQTMRDYIDIVVESDKVSGEKTRLFVNIFDPKQETEKELELATQEINALEVEIDQEIAALEEQ